MCSFCRERLEQLNVFCRERLEQLNVCTVNTPPQVGEWIFTMPNLESKKLNWANPIGLVKISTSWWVVETCKVFNKPAWVFSRRKWQSNSMCLVLSWKTGLAAMWKAAWLSQKRTEALGWGMQKSWRRDKSQVSSQVAIDIARYSASAKERETTVCFLDLQEIKESPKKNTKTNEGSSGIWATSPI